MGYDSEMRYEVNVVLSDGQVVTYGATAGLSEDIAERLLGRLLADGLEVHVRPR